MLVPASAPWAHTTLYYSSFFAANAILGMFGGWIGITRSGNRVIDVERGTPGVQTLKVHRKLRSPSGARGSHMAFWDFFYDAAATVSMWAPLKLQPAFTPVNGDVGWQIAERNNVNYDMFDAWNASTRFFDTFRAKKLKSVQGPLRLQLETTEKLVRVALWFATDLSIPSSAVSGCGPSGTRQQIQRRLVTQQPPSLVTQSELSVLLDA